MGSAPFRAEYPRLKIYPTACLVVAGVGCSRAQPALEGACDCTSNLYNCPSFETKREAQACFEHCEALGVGDIHWLDSDNDGLACECNPRIKERCVRDW